MAALEESFRRDLGNGQVEAALIMLNLLRGNVGGDRRDDEPLPGSEAVLADLDLAVAALNRVSEALVGDLSAQAQRFLEEPGVRTTLGEAALQVGVGGVVRQYWGSPTALNKQHQDYTVVRINPGSVRLRDQGNLSERRHPLGSRWDDRDKDWVALDNTV